MISEIYKQMRFNAGFNAGFIAGFEAGKEAGREEGRKEGREAGRQVERKRIKELLEQHGVELPPDLKEILFGKPEEKRS